MSGKLRSPVLQDDEKFALMKVCLFENCAKQSEFYFTQNGVEGPLGNCLHRLLRNHGNF